MYGCHQGLWVRVKSFVCDRRFHYTLFTYTPLKDQGIYQGIHIQLLYYIHRLIFVSVVAVFALGYFVCLCLCVCAPCGDGM